MVKDKKINFCIGYKDSNGRISTFSIYSSDVWYDTLKDAKSTLKYVRKVDKDKDWKIFIINEEPIE